MGGGHDVLLKSIFVDPVQNRPKSQPEHLVGTQGDIFGRIQLLQHIQHPDHPKHMQPGSLFEKVKAPQNVMVCEVREKQHKDADQDDAPADKAQYVLFANVRNRILYHTNYFLTNRMV